MKIIITEDQFNKLQKEDKEFNKTKTLVNSMFDEGYDIDEILKLTGLDKGAIIVLLYDREVINDEKTKCKDKHEMLYTILWDSGLIDKEHTYEDGSIIDVRYDRLSGSIDFEYLSEGYKLVGYATLMWDADCDLPIDVTYFDDIDGTDYDVDGYLYTKVEIINDKKFNNIKTFRQLVDYFNNDYYNLMKQELDPLLKRARTTYL